MTRPARSQTLVQRALGGHAAIGLFASALLYIVTLTGSLAVIHDQWTRWEEPAAPEMVRLAPEAARVAVATAARAGTHTGLLTLQLPTPDLPRAVVTTERGSWYVDAAGRLAARKEDGWGEFVVTLHETLHLPATWGLIVVGALGVALAALSITGVLAHPRILRDAFRLRARHHPQVARTDWHNRLGVWTLPFALAVAVTGAFLGLGGIGASVLARAYTDNRVERIYAPVFGETGPSDAAPAPLADVGAALRTLAIRVPGAQPYYASVREPGTRGQEVQVFAAHSRRLIFGESYRFGPDGGWRGAAGLADGATGQQVAASTYDLHFGNYAGPLVEIAYLAFGLLLCVVIATGTSIWLHKRHVRGLGGRRLKACWTALVWGAPLALLAGMAARATVGPVPLAAIFWVSIVALLLVAAVVPTTLTKRRLRTALFGAIGVVAAVHLLRAGTFLPGPMMIDLAMLAAALTLPVDCLLRRRGEANVTAA